MMKLSCVEKDNTPRPVFSLTGNNSLPEQEILFPLELPEVLLIMLGIEPGTFGAPSIHSTTKLQAVPYYTNQPSTEAIYWFV